MTLINYLNRVHFADDILEEALWAELDQRRIRCVMVISTAILMGGDLGERFRTGLPRDTLSVEYHVGDGLPTEQAILQALRLFVGSKCEALVGFGSGPVIDVTKLVQLLAATGGPLSRFSTAAGGAHRIVGKMPETIAIPTLKGFASGFNGSASALLESGETIDISKSELVPTVTICDPTIAAMEPAATQAGAGVTAITCCIEALLSPNYNPPADGIAQDGLNRALRSISRATQSDDIEPRRELMAASMNAAMVQQKGLGATHAIVSALDAVSTEPLDRGAIARLVLPEILKFYGAAMPLENQSLTAAFGLFSGQDVVSGLRSVFADLPLPNSLKDAGVAPERITGAAFLAARHRTIANSPRPPATADIVSILQSVA